MNDGISEEKKGENFMPVDVHGGLNSYLELNLFHLTPVTYIIGYLRDKTAFYSYSFTLTSN